MGINNYTLHALIYKLCIYISYVNPEIVQHHIFVHTSLQKKKRDKKNILKCLLTYFLSKTSDGLKIVSLKQCRIYRWCRGCTGAH